MKDISKQSSDLLKNAIKVERKSDKLVVLANELKVDVARAKKGK